MGAVTIVDWSLSISFNLKYPEQTVIPKPIEYRSKFPLYTLSIKWLPSVTRHTRGVNCEISSAKVSFARLTGNQRNHRFEIKNGELNVVAVGVRLQEKPYAASCLPLQTTMVILDRFY